MAVSSCTEVYIHGKKTAMYKVLWNQFTVNLQAY